MNLAVKILSFGLLLMPLSIIVAQSTLTVEIVNLESNKGYVIVELLDKNEESVTDKKGKITDHKSTIVFNNLKNGQYAIKFIHDENNNNEFDTNFMGIPKEGYGFSNDAFGRFGPKEYSKLLFTVSGEIRIRLTAKYLF